MSIIFTKYLYSFSLVGHSCLDILLLTVLILIACLRLISIIPIVKGKLYSIFMLMWRTRRDHFFKTFRWKTWQW